MATKASKKTVTKSASDTAQKRGTARSSSGSPTASNVQLVVNFEAKEAPGNPEERRKRKEYICVCLAEAKELDRGGYAQCLKTAQAHTLKTLHSCQVMED